MSKEGAPEGDDTTPKTDPEDTEAEPEGEPDRKDGDSGDAKQLGDAGKRAIDAMKRERNQARKELNDAKAKLKEFEDKDKSETQRLQESAEEYKTRAAKAEANYKKFSVAMDRAPEHATLKHIRAVAKRLSGESDEDMETDADELYELLAPAPAIDDDKGKDKGKKMPSKPRESLRGGVGEPDDEPEEMSPDKLADLIGRH